MKPLINNDSFVLTKKMKPELNKLFVINHLKYGKMIKKLVKIDNERKYWFTGENFSSVTTDNIGPINLEQILGRVIISFSKKRSKLHI